MLAVARDVVSPPTYLAGVDLAAPGSADFSAIVFSRRETDGALEVLGRVVTPDRAFVAELARRWNEGEPDTSGDTGPSTATNPPAVREVVALVRVSTAKQDPVAQRRAIEKWSEATATPIARWIDEGEVSGALDEDDRPGLAALMAAVRRGEVGTLVVAEWSRLGRDTISQLMRALEMQRKAVRVVVLDDARCYDLDDPDDLLLFFLLCWKSHRERIDTGKRTKRKMEQLVADAAKTGRPHHIGNPGYQWTPEQDAELLRLADEMQMTALEIAMSGIAVVRRRRVDADGRLCVVSKQPRAGYALIAGPPSETSVKDRLRELRRSR